MSTGKVLKNSFIYTIVSVLQKAIGFFLLPVYTVYLSTTDYGITGMVSTVVSFLSLFIMLSLHGAATYFTYEYLGDERKVKRLWGTAICVILLNGVVVLSFITIFHSFTIDKVMKGIDFYPYIFIGILTTFLNSIYTLYQTYLQTLQEGKKYGLNSILYFLINLTLTIIGVVVLKQGVIAVLVATLITNVIFVAYSIFDFIPKIELCIDREILKKSIRYSLPLLPHSLSGWIMTMIDRVFLNNMQSTASVGLYNIGFQFGNLMNIVISAVAQAFTPYFFQLIKSKEDNSKKISVFAESAIVFYCISALGISLFSKDVVELMVSSSFKEAWIVIPILAFSNVFNGIYYMFINVLFENNTKLVPVVTFTGAIANLIFNIILIRKYGFFGSSIANFISLFITSLITYFMAQRIRKISFPILKIYLMIFAIFLISCLVYFVDEFYIRSLIFVLVISLIFYKYRSVLSETLENLIRRRMK